MEVEGPTQAAEPVEEKKPEAASPQQAGLNISASRMEIEGTHKGGLTNESWGASGTRAALSVGRSMFGDEYDKPMTHPMVFIYLTSGSRISGAVPIFRHPCMLPVKHSMVRQPQQKQVRQAQQLRPKLCDSQLLVTRCHESTTEGPSDSLGEKLPITQDIWVHWAQTRFLGVGPPEFIRTFLQDS